MPRIFKICGQPCRAASQAEYTSSILVTRSLQTARSAALLRLWHWIATYAARWLSVRDLRPRTRDTYPSQLAHVLVDFETAEQFIRFDPRSIETWLEAAGVGEL